MTMSLRTRLWFFFLLLATVPLIFLGAFQYRQSRRAVKELIAAQAGVLADHAAAEIADRWTQRESELLLLAENTETQAALRAEGSGPVVVSENVGRTEIEDRAQTYLEEAWRTFGHRYERVELRAPPSRVRFVLKGTGALDAAGPPAIRIDLPILDLESGKEIGVVTARVRHDALFPREALEAGFGHSGSSAVFDATRGRVLWAPRRSLLQQPVETLFGARSSPGLAAAPAGRGTIEYQLADTARVGVYVRLEEPPWTVLASAAVAEFAEPFHRIRTFNLLVVLAGTGLVTAGFALLLRRSTDSLVRLAEAADQIGTGRFDPPLPPGGSDEVGRLSGALGTMATRIREMVSQIERSRQLAAVGEFAAQLAHEIRNPLTSLRLNQQGLERDLAAAEAPEAVRQQVEISLKEISRLERVARGVLDLARPPGGASRRCSVHVAVRDALSLVGPQLAEAGVSPQARLAAGEDVVLADAGELEGVFLNLFLNAAEAMPEGGQLRVASHNPARADGPTRLGAIVRVLVSDTGPGVTLEARERIFDPFFSTKGAGKGLGLSVALQRIEAIGGTLGLVENPEGGGARFQVDLPLAPGKATGESGREKP
jgi:signal transduction histidine kinase